MCGISGLCAFGRDAEANIHAMNLHMRDRGPDAEGIRTSEDGLVTFGHRRLSIIDLTPSGAQPFVSGSGRLLMTYNGEIYDYGKMRAQLLADRIVPGFRGTSDTEVLLEAVEGYGAVRALQQMKGMWAFGIYDTKEKKLLLSRDRVGEKPLYYGWIHREGGETCFGFASDIGAFREVEGFSNGIRKDVLPLYMANGYIPAPYTIYEDIYKLKPGTVLTIDAPFAPFDVPADLDRSVSGSFRNADLEGGYSYEIYWSMKDAARRGQSSPFKGTREEASMELERLLREAIRGQMVADVPLGAFLSAGIDSSTIVSLMQAQSRDKVRTFTIGMHERGFDEAQAAEQIAHHLGTDHTQMYITERDALDVIPKLAGMFGEPFADSSQIPTYLVSRMTRQHVTVSLSGDAGDELFCGYRSYPSLERIWGKMKGVPYGLRSAASDFILHSPLSRKEVLRIKGTLLKAHGPLELGRLQNIAENNWGHVVLAPDTLRAADSFLPEGYLPQVSQEAMLRDLLMYHPDDILVKVDRTAMAVSLESRVPFLDRDVVEFAWTLPIDYLRNDHEGKLVLKDVLYRYVPKDLVDRPKKGFSIPIQRWLRSEELRGWAEDLIAQSKLKAEGYFDAQQVRRLWEDLQQRGIWRPQIWYILMFENWLGYIRK
jgi:asparagine synthase (glutamine-hydrolysing)